MKTAKNGVAVQPAGRRQPVQPLQVLVDGQLVPIVHDDGERACVLLDELDDRIADLDTALADQVAALQLLADADRRVSLARERCRAVHAAISVETSHSRP